MPDTTHTKWNTPKGMLNSRIDDIDDYVLVGRKQDGSTIVLSNGDEQFASKLLQNSTFANSQRESASFGG